MFSGFAMVVTLDGSRPPVLLGLKDLITMNHLEVMNKIILTHRDRS